jgi:hypothetical protein
MFAELIVNMNVLLEIPQPIAGLILTEWMDVVEVGRLDSAFCNRQQRPAFRNTAYLSGTAYHARLYAGEEYEKLARWSILRQAKLDSVQFTALFQNIATYASSFANKWPFDSERFLLFEQDINRFQFVHSRR